MLKRIASGFSALLLSMTSLFVFAPMIASAATDVCTWDGSSNTNFNTAGNWSCASDGEAVPGAGDTLKFPYGTGVTNKSLNNDIAAGTSFAAIIFDAPSALTQSETAYTLAGNALKLTTALTTSGDAGSAYISSAVNLNVEFSSDSTISSVTNLNITIGGIVSGSGDIEKTGLGMLYLSGSNTFTGNFNAAEGSVYVSYLNGLGSSAGSTTIGPDGYLSYDITEANRKGTIAEPFILNNARGVILNVSCGGDYCDDELIKLSGDIEILRNIKWASYNDLKLTGALSGEYTIGIADGNPGKLIIDSSDNNTKSKNATYEARYYTKKYTDKTGNEYASIPYRETGILTGKYYSAYVAEGGTLKGTGTIKNSLYATTGSLVAPGLSPGCLTTANLFMYGQYQVEIAGTKACSKHDQLIVNGEVSLSEDYDDDNADNDVQGTLSASFIDKYKPTKGEKFIIINNDKTDKVIGTFKGLKEGATFKTPGESVLKISYKGGTGNDVELTLLKVGTPDTGFGLLLNNPAAILAATVLSAGAILMMSRRFAPATTGKRKSRR